ncbi:MAG: 4Fe-4S dicluster domain-containing protein, partial [Planctomycetes bacterium]|nr:4Fe-4S dicluster domain-containing protein [Planctomycetota bacterium]
AWASTRTLEGESPKFSRTIVLESAMSLTGSNADERIQIRPSQRGAWVAGLYQRIAKFAGQEVHTPSIPEGVDAAKIDRLARELWAARGKSLVVIHTEKDQEALVVNGINLLLGNYGKTLSVATPTLIAQGRRPDTELLIEEMELGKVGVLVTLGVNPVYDLPQGARFASAMAKVGTSLVLTDRVDESAEHATFVGPLDHFLESWNDHQPQQGLYSITQPMVRRLFTTEAGGRVLLALAESVWGKRHWRAFVRDTWRNEILGPGDPRWEQCLEQGVLDKREFSSEPSAEAELVDAALFNAVGVESSTGSGLELVAYESVAIGDGRHANNPWLQELPDPLTKATWDNFAIVSPKVLAQLDAQEGDYVALSAGELSMTLPLLAQPGMAEGCVAIAKGYGRSAAGRLARSLPDDAKAIGVNVFPFLHSGQLSLIAKLTGDKAQVARSQTHDSQEGRPHACETTLEHYLSARDSGTPRKHAKPSMWEELKHEGHYWGMSVDLNACTGCSGCIVSCQAENNIPVVGREEVALRRDMAWLRLDRYYSDDEASDDLSVVDENPRVMHQPMMCQHCDHAPCETVCPVAATTHSEEGLNQQTYNRCVGTRYCANNCPTKVRRFNWFDYDHTDEVMNLVLNPDVTIRSRGIMEKCSLCVQRIYDAKLEASREGRAFADGDFKTACQQSCPTNAIVVGDMNDPESAVSKMMASQRSYEVLGELNLQAGVRYMTRVRNTGKAER